MAPKITPKSVTAPPAAVRTALGELSKSTADAFVERAELANHLVAALVGRHHCWLYGPPGVAKSAIIRYVMASFPDCATFIRQMSARTSEERVFGPWKLSALKQDRYERDCTGYAPTADVVFLDEGGRSDRVLRDALLMLMNEREYENGGAVHKAPLISLFSGSNSVLTDPEDEAFVDRFLVSCLVEDIRSPDAFGEMLFGAAAPGPLTFRTSNPSGIAISRADLQTAQTAAAGLRYAPEWRDELMGLREKLAHHGITVSPRRWRESLGALRAYAWLEGAEEVAIEHGEYLADMLWKRTDDRRTVQRILGESLNPALARAVQISDEVAAEVAKVPVNDQDPNFMSVVPTVNRKLKAALADIDALLARMKPERAGKVQEIRRGIASSAENLVRRTRARNGI